MRAVWRIDRSGSAGTTMLCAAVLGAVVAIAMLSSAALAQGSPGPGSGLKQVVIGFVRHAYGTWTAKIADGSFDTATGRTLRWLAFDSDSGVAAAMAAGRVDVGLMGDGVVAAAYARGLPLKIFFVMGAASDTEGLVVDNDATFRAGDASWLSHKVIAVPFGSTPHLRLLQSMKLWGVPAGGVRLVNLQAQQIGEAWERHELDAAAVSEPLLGRLRTKGRFLPLAAAGSFDGLLVLAGTSEFVSSNVVVLARLVDAITRADAMFSEMSGPLSADRPEVQAIAFATGLDAQEIVTSIARYRPPKLSEQVSAQWLGSGADSALVAHVRACAELWRWGGRLDRADADFSQVVTTEPVERALEYQK